jgi:energy-coupling factor transporter transmembrane protein EcfT
MRYVPNRKNLYMAVVDVSFFYSMVLFLKLRFHGNIALQVSGKLLYSLASSSFRTCTISAIEGANVFADIHIEAG